jgi:ribosomal protein S18 acetylase RimI-like enzyme
MLTKIEMNIQIQRLSEADIPQAMELKNALGWNQTPADWQRFLLLSPEGSFKAMRGEELVATAIAYVFDKVCWIGMVIVKEGCRHQGVGRQIMASCLGHSAEKNCNLIMLDATRDGVHLYGRLGFHPEYLVGTVRGKVKVAEAGIRASAASPEVEIRRIQTKDLDAVVSLESVALGAVREALLYHLLRQNPGHGFAAYRRGQQLDGFVLYRPGFHSTQVGPLIARSDKTAVCLLENALADLPTAPESSGATAAGSSGAAAAATSAEAAGKGVAAATGVAEVALTVPINNSAVQEFLRARSLSVDPRLTRMYRGRKRLHAREDMVYALSGPEKG